MSYVVLMGGPGAGKGTQARMLQDSIGLPQIATGDLLRENVKNATDLGKAARQYMDAGELVPDELIVAMVRDRLSRADCANGALLDGYPRTTAQAVALDELLAEMDEQISVVPYIHVSNDVLLKRLSGRWTCREKGHVYHDLFNPPQEAGMCDIDGSPLYQREDDTVETQRRRIEVYLRQTAPLLDHFRQKGLLVEINGEQSIDEVQNDIVAAIKAAG